jgi:hypothetical protein
VEVVLLPLAKTKQLAWFQITPTALLLRTSSSATRALMDSTLMPESVPPVTPILIVPPSTQMLLVLVPFINVLFVTEGSTLSLGLVLLVVRKLTAKHLLLLPNVLVLTTTNMLA